jgi:hypothetical protein
MGTTDKIAVKYTATVVITISPINKYGDEMPGGQIIYHVSLTAPNLSEIMARLERITEER